MKQSSNKGFTLIELLIVIGIISILAAIVFVAIDPAKRFADTRNSRRSSEVSSIVNAVLQYAVDNNGDYPPVIDDITGTAQRLGTAATGCDSPCAGGTVTTVAACVNLGTGYLMPTYLGTIPQDPKTGSEENTGYYINQNAGDRIVVGACDPENGQTIKVTR